jgi:hypothetical protein
MITYLKFLSMEASCHGFDNARHLHSLILTDMEHGLYGWLQKEGSLTPGKTMWCCQEMQIFWKKVSKTLIITIVKIMLVQKRKFKFSKAPQGELTALPYYNYNLSKCRQAADHGTGNLLWRHICMIFLQEGHVERSCTRQRVLNQ